jgi:hypothetical protein
MCCIEKSSIYQHRRPKVTVTVMICLAHPQVVGVWLGSRATETKSVVLWDFLHQLMEHASLLLV